MHYKYFLKYTYMIFTFYFAYIQSAGVNNNVTEPAISEKIVKTNTSTNVNKDHFSDELTVKQTTIGCNNSELEIHNNKALKDKNNSAEILIKINNAIGKYVELKRIATHEDQKILSFKDTIDEFMKIIVVHLCRLDNHKNLEVNTIYDLLEQEKNNIDEFLHTNKIKEEEIIAQTEKQIQKNLYYIFKQYGWNMCEHLVGKNIYEKMREKYSEYLIDKHRQCDEFYGLIGALRKAIIGYTKIIKEQLKIDRKRSGQEIRYKYLLSIYQSIMQCHINIENISDEQVKKKSTFLADKEGIVRQLIVKLYMVIKTNKSKQTEYSTQEYVNGDIRSSLSLNKGKKQNSQVDVNQTVHLGTENEYFNENKATDQTKNKENFINKEAKQQQQSTNDDIFSFDPSNNRYHTEKYLAERAAKIAFEQENSHAQTSIEINEAVNNIKGNDKELINADTKQNIKVCQTEECTNITNPICNTAQNLQPDENNASLETFVRKCEEVTKTGLSDIKQKPPNNVEDEVKSKICDNKICTKDTDPEKNVKNKYKVWLIGVVITVIFASIALGIALHYLFKR